MMLDFVSNNVMCCLSTKRSPLMPSPQRQYEAITQKVAPQAAIALCSLEPVRLRNFQTAAEYKARLPLALPFGQSLNSDSIPTL